MEHELPKDAIRGCQKCARLVPQGLLECAILHLWAILFTAIGSPDPCNPWDFRHHPWIETILPDIEAPQQSSNFPPF